MKFKIPTVLLILSYTLLVPLDSVYADKYIGGSKYASDGIREKRFRVCKETLLYHKENKKCLDLVKRVTKEKVDYYQKNYLRIIKTIEENFRSQNYSSAFFDCEKVIKYVPKDTKCKEINEDIFALERDFSSRYVANSEVKNKEGKMSLINRIYNIFSNKNICKIEEKELNFCHIKSLLGTENHLTKFKKEKGLFREVDSVLTFSARHRYSRKLNEIANTIVNLGGKVPACKYDFELTIQREDLPKKERYAFSRTKLLSVNNIPIDKKNRNFLKKCKEYLDLPSWSSDLLK